MHQIRLLTLLFLFNHSFILFAQKDTPVYAVYTTSRNRTKLYTAISRSIGNLSKPLTDSTEDLWQAAFSGMELIYHTSPWEVNRIHTAFDSISFRSLEFQRSLLELIYSNYPNQFINEINELVTQTTNEKIFAMCAEYLLRNKNDTSTVKYISTLLQSKFNNLQQPILYSLKWRVDNPIPGNLSVLNLFNKDFLPGNVVMYSFQRKNRDLPGLVLVRDSEGNFVREDNGNIFNVPQLARSLSNLPGYLTNGSTPQGIFRMYGFAVSQSTFIGPTTNIQLTMPGETSLKHFMKDSTILDSIWSREWYSKLLPTSLQSYFPLYGSYYAGMAGRTEIISHGTTVDPDYYHSKIFFPYTPTEGCLCTKEFWSPVDGRRLESDQQKLVNAIRKAGGPDGYCIVLELNDEQRPVSIQDVLSFTSMK